MTALLLAIKRTLLSLGHGRIWLYMLTPALVGLVLLVGMAIFLLDALINLFAGQPPLDWLAAWGAQWLALALAWLGGWVSILAASTLLVVLLTGILLMPLMLEHLAVRDYPDLARLGRENLAASAWNSLTAVLLFAAGWLVTLPLWLIPGMSLVLPLFWLAWISRRTFAYDALGLHALAEERQILRQRHGWPLLLIGLGMAVLTHVPLLGLLAPALAALAYIHYCLEALRCLRQEKSAASGLGNASLR